jgi:DNA processing protein
MLLGMPEIQRVLRLHPEFPPRLHELSKWPAELQIMGTLSLDGPIVAIVGARAASAEGMQHACALAAGLAAAGYRIISGGALGIDSASHRGALGVGGYTVAVMACGLDKPYPRRNARLFANILAAKGALVSPYPVGAEPKPGHFVRRNQVIAALADAVVVVEAGLASGSLHTARFARSMGRPLASYAGTPGCEALLSKGVPLVACADDVVQLLAGRAHHKEVPDRPAPGSPEAMVLAKLKPRRAQDALGLARAANLPLRQTQRILHRLELSNLALLRTGQRYVRSPLAGLPSPGEGS